MSVRTEVRLKSPQLEDLEIYISQLEDSIEQKLDITFGIQDAQTLLDILRWQMTFLCNRKDYHKKRSVGQRIERQLLEEALRRKGVDVESIKRRALNETIDTIVDESRD